MQMETLRLTQIVRPVRFLFLVSREREDQVDLAMRLSTTLWGGRFNPIAVVEQDPDAIESLWQASKSDYGVNLTGAPWPPMVARAHARMARPIEGDNGLLAKDSGGMFVFRLGCDIQPLLSDFWERQGRFSDLTRGTQSPSVALLQGGTPWWQSYATVSAGAYPSGMGFDYERAFCNATACEKVRLDDTTSSRWLKGGYITPLGFTLARLDIRYTPRWRPLYRSVFYLGDVTNVEDRVEFWNLRALGEPVTFVPYDKVPLFTYRIARAFENAAVAGDQIPGSTVLVHVASGLPEEAREASIAAMREAGDDHSSIAALNSLPTSGLDLWTSEEGSRGHRPLEAPLCEAHEQEDLVHYSGNRIQFKIACPEFLTRFSNDFTRSWHVSLRGSVPPESDLWIDLPARLSVEDMLLDHHHLMLGDFRLCPRDNIVLLQAAPGINSVVSLWLPDSLEVFQALFAEHGIAITDYSEKGRYALAIEEALGGLLGDVILVRHSGVRDALHRLSTKSGRHHLPREKLVSIMTQSPDSGTESMDVRRTINPSQVLDRLIESGVLRAGLEFKCGHCYRKDWYDASEFGTSYVCHFCYTEQPTPVLDKQKWRFRASGLFGTRDVGFGSLPVICTSLFFRLRYHFNTRFIYSFELKDRQGDQREIDLAVMRLESGQEPEIAVCECKTSRFERQDFDRLKAIVASIPASIACAATLAQSLSQEELTWAKQLWDEGHRLILMARDVLQEPESALADEARMDFRAFTSFARLADATRVKYLGE
jgi:hypothetical protein